LEQVEPKDGDEAQELMDVTAIDYKVNPPGDWKDSTTIIVEQNEPLPAHVVAIFAKLIGADE
jgi:signal recognition particle subunit SEC65